MFLALLFLLAPLIFGGPLSEEENAYLQQNCGRPVLTDGKPTSELRRVKRTLFGDTAHPDEAPWVVAIGHSHGWFPDMTEEEFEASVGQDCSATLISSRHIATVGHCAGWECRDCESTDVKFGLKNLHRLTVRIGTNCVTKRDCKAGQQEYIVKHVRSVKQVFMLPHVACNPSNDFAIYELEEDVPFDEKLFPACLNDYDAIVGDTVELFGYGGDPYDSKKDSAILKKQDATVIPCGDPNDANFCTRSNETLNCGGDSGSGRIYRDESGRAFLSGVISHTNLGCHDEYQRQLDGRPSGLPYSSAYNVRVSHHLSWMCLATGICATEKAKEDARTKPELSKRYHIIHKLNGNDLYK